MWRYADFQGQKNDAYSYAEFTETKWQNSSLYNLSHQQQQKHILHYNKNVNVRVRITAFRLQVHVPASVFVCERTHTHEVCGCGCVCLSMFF